MAKRPAYAKHEPRLQALERRLAESECQLVNLLYIVKSDFEERGGIITEGEGGVYYIYCLPPSSRPLPWWKRLMGIEQ